MESVVPTPTVLDDGRTVLIGLPVDEAIALSNSDPEAIELLIRAVVIGRAALDEDEDAEHA